MTAKRMTEANERTMRLGARITAADLLDAGEVARLVRADRRTVLRWALEGNLPSIKRGRRVLFLRCQVEQWLLDGARGQSL